MASDLYRRSQEDMENYILPSPWFVKNNRYKLGFNDVQGEIKIQLSSSYAFGLPKSDHCENFAFDNCYCFSVILFYFDNCCCFISSVLFFYFDYCFHFFSRYFSQYLFLFWHPFTSTDFTINVVFEHQIIIVVLIFFIFFLSSSFCLFIYQSQRSC